MCLLFAMLAIDEVARCLHLVDGVLITDTAMKKRGRSYCQVANSSINFGPVHILGTRRGVCVHAIREVPVDSTSSTILRRGAWLGLENDIAD